MLKVSTITKYFIALLFMLLSGVGFSYAQMDFVQNKGQWDSKVDYKGMFSTGSFFLEKQGFTVLMHKVSDLEVIAAQMHGHDNAAAAPGTVARPLPVGQPVTLHSFAYKVKFLGSSANAFVQPEKAQNTYNNYFIGNDPTKWASDCKLYQAVVYKNVYPNIDVRYYTAGDKMKYDFIVRPGGNPNAIAIRYDGPQLEIRNKELIIKTSVGDATELEPYTYQPGLGKPVPVECKYKLEDNVVSFQIKNYDPTKTLVIDPSIIFVSLTGSTSDNWGFTATPGADGSFYAGGISFGTGYPTSAGAYDVTYNGGVTVGETGGHDVAIFKFSANGSNRLYATYIGGARNEQPHSLIEDGQGNLIIAGTTNSGGSGGAAFPTLGGASAASSGNDYDIFVTKLNRTGTAILGSAKIGGSGNDGVNIRLKYEQQGKESLRRNYGDDARSEVIVDAANNIILASCTQSTNFPVRNSGIQNNNAGAQDGVILKINPSFSTLVFSTYFGGAGDDANFVLGINPSNNNIYVGGSTASPTLPGTTAGTIASSSRGLIDGFVTIINPAGTAIVRTTFIGTSNIDLLYGLKFDKMGFPYIMGTTLSTSWPVINAAFSNPGAKQFIAKLEPDLSAYVFSTTFGTNVSEPNISPIAFLVDKCENVYVSGWGGGLNVGLNYSSGTTSGLQEVNPLANIPAADGSDFYFFVLEKNANSILFASHFGQNGGLGDHVDGGTSRFDEAGVIYQAICANCGRNGTFPTTAGVFGPFNGTSSGCNQAAVKIEMNFGGVGAKLQSSINGSTADTTACLGDPVTFRDILGQGKTFIFDFGDGSPRVTTRAPVNSAIHTYSSIGTYTIMLIAEDSAKCNIRDTTYKTITVADNKVGITFNVLKGQPCTSLNYSFTNTSTTNGVAFPPGSFEWDYGDGSPRDRVNGFAPTPAMHTYPATGTYTVRLYLIDPNYCNSPDSANQTLRVNPIVKAIFTTPALGCAPYTALFTNQSQAGTAFEWQFDNGTTFSTATDATFTFVSAGTYRVRLIANDPSTCNLTDTSAFFTITVLPKPTALADWAPNPPIENVPVRFTNLSSAGSVRYKWFFGDGDSSTLTNPVHEYNATGTYTAQLIAFNQLSCSDTFNLQVRVIILPALDVPNAFTPGKFGENGIVKVRGFGIVKLNWNIYNRWGQLVFSSSSKNSGWDGTFKGKLQPMDVYTYTLEVEMFDGEKIRKTGDITLLK